MIALVRRQLHCLLSSVSRLLGSSVVFFRGWDSLTPSAFSSESCFTCKRPCNLPDPLDHPNVSYGGKIATCLMKGSRMGQDSEKSSRIRNYRQEHCFITGTLPGDGLNDSLKVAQSLIVF